MSASQMPVGETYFALLQYDYNTSGAATVTATVFDGSSSKVARHVFMGLDLDGYIGRLGFATSDFSPTVVADEWRFGTELSNVMVPEPTSILLLLATLAGGLLVNRR